ncbi:hypothetical protein LENED_006826 [Lentinula edodes]|uniref:Ribosomal protein s17 n=1 Tax=Lentinula edodes TaxID=5353 RepID=A0A1Q3ECQ9_LENED|nr:hypothetical protein LENED_006826 [Lentinula edodes]
MQLFCRLKRTRSKAVIHLRVLLIFWSKSLALQYSLTTLNKDAYETAVGQALDSSEMSIFTCRSFPALIGCLFCEVLLAVSVSAAPRGQQGQQGKQGQQGQSTQGGKGAANNAGAATASNATAAAATASNSTATTGNTGSTSTATSVGALSSADITTNATENNPDAQSSLTLDPRVIATGFLNNGQDVQEAGQVASLTSNNNFINYCLTQGNLPITNGLQTTTGSCNPAPIGTIPSVQNMPSAKFASPANGDTIAANTEFTITMNINNLALAQGQIIGHTHVVIEALSDLAQTTPTNPQQFAFFKGVNTCLNGAVTADVTSGVPAGAYRLCSINSSSNHQPVIVPIAQHGSLDDCVYFTASGDGATASNATAAAAGAANSTAAGTAAAAAGTAAAATGAAATASNATAAAAGAGSAAAAGAGAQAGAQAAKGQGQNKNPGAQAQGQAAGAKAGNGKGKRSRLSRL